MSGDSGTVVQPGRAFYAPAVRVSRLGATGNAAGDILTEIQGDITEVEVTLLANGISTYTISLNNSFLSTRAEREIDSSLLQAEQQESTTLLGAHNNPVWPRFKYDSFRVFAFGMRLRIDMRYLPATPGPAGTQPSADSNWVPMIAGPIADMRFTFGDDGLRLQISGQDDLSRLQDKQAARIPFDRKAEMSLVRDALRRAGFAGTAEPPAVTRPRFVDNDGNGLQEQIQAGQSLFEFIDKFAKKLDFELFTDFASLDVPASALEVHFEPCRSRRAPDPATVPTLAYGSNLLDFKPTFKVRDQFSAVTVRGRHRDPQVPEEVRGRANRDLLRDELYARLPPPGADANGPAPSPPTPAPDVRERFFRGRANEPSFANRGNLDSERAQMEAEAELRRMARDLLTMEATTIGSPRLRPGRHVDVQGLRVPFDGYFYVTQTKHTLSDTGYRTVVHGCRPGMDVPANAWSA